MNYHRLKLRQLHVLLAIAQHGGVSRAARALAITQPAVTKTLAELEDIVGQRLLERTRKGIALSPAGQILVRYAGSSVRTLREGLESIAQAHSPEAPTIVIGALPNVAATVLPPALERFVAAVPQARVRVRTGSNAYLVNLLRQGDLDVVMGRLNEPADMHGLTFEYLFSEPLVFAVRRDHPLLKQTRFTLSMLFDYRMVLPDAHTRARAAADEFLLAAGLGQVTRTIETIDASFGRSFVLRTDAVWFVPRGVVETDIQHKTLACLPLDTQSSAGPVGLSTRVDSVPSDALQCLLTEVRKAAAERQ